MPGDVDLTSPSTILMLTCMPNTPVSTPLGAELRRVRFSLEMTLQEFGEHVGVPWQTIAAYETGRVVPPADRLLAIFHKTRRAPEAFRVDRVARELAKAAA